MNFYPLLSGVSGDSGRAGLPAPLCDDKQSLGPSEVPRFSYLEKR